MRFFVNLRIIILLPVLFVAACTERQPLPAVSGERGLLTFFSEEGTLTKSQLLTVIHEPGLAVQDIVKYDVTYHKLTYITEYEGQLINATGLMILPVGLTNPSVLAYFHGTIVPVKLVFEKDVPSLYRESAEDFRQVRTMGLSFASAGYAVFLPDYVGYGLTEEKEHPYMNYPEMFKANIDGLLAARQFMTDKGLSDSGRIFLAGWSQGGGAALSAHKYIQESYADKFTVVASSSLAGPFNLSRLVGGTLENYNQEQDVSFIVSWALYGINKFSDLKRPTDQIWQYPVASQYDAAFTPVIIKTPGKIFKRTFIEGITKSIDRPFVDALKRMSIHEGWKSVGKVILHHGNSDRVVSYANSTDALTGLQKAGGDVKLYTYQGGDHDTNLGEFDTNTLIEFGLLK